MFTDVEKTGIMDAIVKSISFENAESERLSEDLIYDIATIMINDYLSMIDEFHYSLVDIIDEVHYGTITEEIYHFFLDTFSPMYIDTRNDVLYEPAYRASSYIVLTEVENSDNYEEPHMWISQIAESMSEFASQFMNTLADEIETTSHYVLEEINKSETDYENITKNVFKFIDEKVVELRDSAKDVKPNPFFTALADRLKKKKEE